MGLPNFQGLSFEPGGTLFAWSIFQGLHTVNVATGLATDVNTGFNNGGFDIQAIDFAGDGTLFGARDRSVPAHNAAFAAFSSMRTNPP